MVLKISQETFNAAVKENIEDLGMEPQEALEEAIKQFEAQGVDLSTISKALAESTDEVDNIVKGLVDLNLKKETNEETLKSQLELLKAKCDQDINLRVAAGNAGAYLALLQCLEKNRSNNVVVIECLKALGSLMSKQPDLFDDKGLELFYSLITPSEDYAVKKFAFKWARECCMLHEMNKQKFMETGIVEKVKPLLEVENPDVLREILALFRALVLDDDVRVEFGKAHEHARIIASETLCSLTELLTKYSIEDKLICDLMLTLSSLLVRSEFCKKLEEAGGLKLIKDVLSLFEKNEKINRQCFKLLKALAGNDEVKERIIQCKLAPSIISAINNHKTQATTAATGLSCIAALSLRSPNNSKALFEAGMAELIVELMKLHPEDKSVQRSACWAIRNMVSRSRYQSKLFLLCGVEGELKRNLQKFKEFEYDTKAALRDLGCDVNLKEEWTGKGGALTSGNLKIGEDLEYNTPN